MLISGFGNHQPRIDQHGLALAASLRVPDDATLAAALGRSRLNRRFDCDCRGMELVVASKELVDGAGVGSDRRAAPGIKADLGKPLECGCSTVSSLAEPPKNIPHSLHDSTNASCTFFIALPRCR